MAALEGTRSNWRAIFIDREEGILPYEALVEIVRTKWDHESVAYFWCMKNGCGEWPGTDSDEWIEYTPAPRQFFTRGDSDELWYRLEDGTIIQMTKG